MTQKIRSAFSIGALILLTAVSAFAQTGTVMPSPKFTGFDNNGLVINSGRLCTYAAGTTTPQATYSDVGLAVANTNPIVLDPAGRATVFLSATSYKFVLRAAGGALTGNTAIDCAATTQLWSQDNVSAIPTTSAGVDVTGVAGEAITAGQAVYLSDGSGGKNAGQWYKADAANAYSSTTNWVGVAPNAIGSAASGTIRLAGSVSGLSSLTIGSTYYVGTAGALTATAPAVNSRKVGQADSATTLVVTASPPPLVTPVIFVDDFRLSLTTATCATATDVTAATTLFLTPCTGNRITLFDTSGNPEYCSTAEVSIAVPASTSQMYDVWAYDSTFGTCTVTLELLAWTNDTTRATAIARSSGRWTKSGNTSRMLIASFRTTTVSGQTEDSLTKRYVWNLYNQRPRALRKQEATANWAYTSATIRQANAAAGNQVEVVVGVAEVLLRLSVSAVAANSAGTASVAAGIGEDSTTAFAAEMLGGWTNTAVASQFFAVTARLDKMPAIGRHYYAWLEGGAANNTFYGASAGFTGTQVGLSGWIDG